jgi:hypothetical protein
MPSAWISLLVFPVLVTPAVSKGPSAESAEEMLRLGQELNAVLASLVEVCQVAWTFDNLRPTVARAVWPEGTPFRPPQAPIIHLSPGSANYQEIVGEMAFGVGR